MRSISLRILYEDNHLLAVAKAPGVLVQADSSGDDCLVEEVRRFIQRRDKKPGKAYLACVHRIDRPASGVVLTAKTSKAAARLSKSFRDGEVEKVYLAVVEGRPTQKNRRLTGWILKNAARNMSRLVSEGTPGAKFAALRARYLGSAGAWSLLRIDLETGRSHQIRVQLSAAGLPVAGDRRYGAKSGFGPMLGLHAGFISFPHPTKEERVRITAPPPAAWEEAFGPALMDLIRSVKV